MARYRVIAASVNIHAGVLGLELHQAQGRQHRLRPCGDNRYWLIDPPVAFKRGEEFEYDGELPKHLVESVTSCPVPTVGDDPPPGKISAPPLILQPDDPFPVIDAGAADGVAEKAPKRKKASRA